VLVLSRLVLVGLGFEGFFFVHWLWVLVGGFFVVLETDAVRGGLFGVPFFSYGNLFVRFDFYEFAIFVASVSGL
jgi:hypothetical protein